MKIIDISRALTADLAPWPGDTPFSFTTVLRIPQGASVNLGRITMSLHNGSHADARFHFEEDGWRMEAAPLEAYLGPAVVVDLSHKFVGESMPEMTVEDLVKHEAAMREAPRVLLKTNVWRDSAHFPERIPTIASDVPAWLQARGVKLLGFDVPSVDAIDSKDLPNHHALGAAGICIVESIDLSAVEEGRYQFAALPLKIVGGDGAPVRAVLWRE